ncbi:GMC family oxidoreductase [Aspergillus stella-maris]|uniref:GMC family oxidoreductase n=1 Tax=Aspergillus stella-maris TaxID=1810926 RepID=UPI003CCD4D62
MESANLPVICDLPAFLDRNYDYIIVGGGAAGLVLASRLSEDPNISVGVLEAGEARLGDQNIASPVGMAAMFDNPDYDWCFRSTPQKGNNEKTFHVSRGKMLGGSSGINFMAYVRPSREDIDNWERLGPSMKGWNWNTLEPYYRKGARISQGTAEMRGPQDTLRVNSASHGDGPIATSHPPWRFPVEDSLIHALDEVSGLPRPEDPFSGDHLGFFGTLSHIDRSDGAVRSDATAYLKGTGARANLRILPNAFAAKLLLNADSGQIKAQEVEFTYGGNIYSVNARRETILACGTIQTPQILELSGIGDPAILQAADIPTRVPLPAVGTNLQDHPMTAVTYELKPKNETLDSLFADHALFGQYMNDFLTSGTGPVGGCMSLGGYIPYASLVHEARLKDTLNQVAPSGGQENLAALTKELLQSSTSASVQITGVPANFSTESGHSSLKDAMPGAPAGHGPCYTFLVANSYPLSRGSCHITSSDPTAAPQIDLGVLTNPVDVDVLTAGAQFADKVFRSSHVAHKIVQRISPPPSVDINDWDQVKAYAQDQILIYNHLIGTCAMGSVVDERLRVYGVQGLRVADASVIPLQMSGNIIATVYAVAERAADLIKEDAKAL